MCAPSRGPRTTDRLRGTRDEGRRTTLAPETLLEHLTVGADDDRRGEEARAARPALLERHAAAHKPHVGPPHGGHAVRIDGRSRGRKAGESEEESAEVGFGGACDRR